MIKNISLVLLSPIVLLGCTLFTDQVNTANAPNIYNSPSKTTENKTVSTSQPVNKQYIASEFIAIGTFTIKELFAFGSGGCGMSLQAKTEANPQNFLFFNGINPNSMVMKINGKMTKFSRLESVGNEFYGQKNFQTFISEDGKIEVRVAVSQGKRGEIESRSIDAGVMLIRTENRFQEISVTGDAGC